MYAFMVYVCNMVYAFKPSGELVNHTSHSELHTIPEQLAACYTSARGVLRKGTSAIVHWSGLEPITPRLQSRSPNQ